MISSIGITLGAFLGLAIAAGAAGVGTGSIAEVTHSATPDPVSPGNWHAATVQLLNSSVSTATSSMVRLVFNITSAGVGKFYIAVVSGTTSILSPDEINSGASSYLTAGFGSTLSLISQSGGVGVSSQQFSNVLIVNGSSHVLVADELTLSNVPFGTVPLRVVVFQDQSSPNVGGITPISIGTVETFQLSVGA